MTLRLQKFNVVDSASLAYIVILIIKLLNRVKQERTRSHTEKEDIICVVRQEVQAML